MSKYIVYDKKTGEVIHEHYGWPTDLDPLTEKKQQEILEAMYPDKYYEVNMIVDVGHNAVKFRDVLSSEEVEVSRFVNGKQLAKKRKIMKVNHKKVKDITGKRR